MDFYGDIFETEDQRNWTDSSFKTYSTPLSVPYPVVVEKGTKISQCIILKMDGQIQPDHSGEEQVKITAFPDEKFIIPPVGISRSSRYSRLSSKEISVLKTVRFDHYRIELHLFENSWKEVADQAIAESDGLGCSLEFVLLFDDAYIDQAKEFIDWAASRQPKAACLILFHRSHPATSDELAKNVIPLFRKFFHDVRIGTGTNANFVQLNRNRTSGQQADYACYSIHPQEHASDNRTLVENLEAQAHTVKSAKEFSGNKGIWISMVTIQRRFNANNSFYETAETEIGLPHQVDSRMMSLFGACWTAGSLKYLLESGISGVTYFETAGERGIIQGDYSSRWPEDFRSNPGMIFPVFHVLRFVLASKSFRVVRSVSSDPLKVESLVMSDGKKVRIVIVNFTGENQTVITGQLKGQFTIREMNETNFPEAVSDHSWLEKPCKTRSMTHDTLLLSPFSVTFIEVSEKL
jgi:hypothetical protein